MMLASGPVPPLAFDPDSRIKIPVDTPMKRFYEEHVAYLDVGDYARLVEEHYHHDAVVISAGYVVIGREQLLEHFARYCEMMGHLEVLSTDRWVESENTMAFEATARTQLGMARVHDAFVLRDGKIYRHFTGVIPIES
jgi:hypothetical protein